MNLMKNLKKFEVLLKYWFKIQVNWSLNKSKRFEYHINQIGNDYWSIFNLIWSIKINFYHYSNHSFKNWQVSNFWRSE